MNDHTAYFGRHVIPDSCIVQAAYHKTLRRKCYSHFYTTIAWVCSERCCINVPHKTNFIPGLVLFFFLCPVYFNYITMSFFYLAEARCNIKCMSWKKTFYSHCLTLSQTKHFLICVWPLEYNYTCMFFEFRWIHIKIIIMLLNNTRKTS